MLAKMRVGTVRIGPKADRLVLSWSPVVSCVSVLHQYENAIEETWNRPNQLYRR